LIHRCATSDADRLIADRLSSLIDEHRGQPSTDADEDDDGAAGSPVPVASLSCCCCDGR
jgi:hypothetical protein